MPTTSRTHTTSAPSAATSSMADVLKHQLDNAESSTIYVPLEDGADTPTDDELKALTAEGIHAELDVVRNALAVRKATDEEIAEATAPVETAPTATATSDN